jgi:hypothetical protein
MDPASTARALLATVVAMIAFGLVHVVTGAPVFYTPPPEARLTAVAPLTLFLVLSAFAQGCSALTGV